MRASLSRFSYVQLDMIIEILRFPIATLLFLSAMEFGFRPEFLFVRGSR